MANGVYANRYLLCMAVGVVTACGVPFDMRFALIGLALCVVIGLMALAERYALRRLSVAARLANEEPPVASDQAMPSFALITAANSIAMVVNVGRTGGITANVVAIIGAILVVISASALAVRSVDNAFVVATLVVIGSSAVVLLAAVAGCGPIVVIDGAIAGAVIFGAKATQ